MLAVLWLASCVSPQPLPEVNEPAAAPKEVALEPAPGTPPPEPTAQPSPEAKPPAPPSADPLLKYTGVFASPESVLYDAAADRYLVSNINGKPTDVDGNGYILELSPDGRVTNPKLIAGGVNKANLDAPKGLAIVGAELWVADITFVRRFDLKSGAQRGEIKLPGASFANDVVAAPNGGAYVSDSGLSMGALGFEPTGTDQVFFIDKAGKVKVIAKSKELGGPNGLAIGMAGALLVNTFGKDEVYRLTEAGKREEITKIPGEQLDGLLLVGDTLLVSSWKAETVYRGKFGGSFEPMISKVKGPGDLGYDSKRNRLLVPRFLEDRVEVYDLK